MNRHPVGIAAINQAEDFFGKKATDRLSHLCQTLDEQQIDYVIEEDFALIAHGCSWGTNRVVFRVATEHHVTAEGIFAGMSDVRVRSCDDISKDKALIGNLKFLRLELLIDRKLSRAISNPSRIGDLADVQGLIRQRRLGRRFATKLNPSVRDVFLKLLQEVRDNPISEE